MVCFQIFAVARRHVEDRKTLNILISTLPHNARESDVVIVRGGAVIIDAQKTAEKKKDNQLIQYFIQVLYFNL